MKSIMPLPPEINVIDVLADAIIEKHQNTSWDVANDLILMPNSRSARNLEDILISHTEGMILPKIRVISELNVKDLLMFGSNVDLSTIPKNLNGQKQLFLLVRLILEWQRQKEKDSIHLTPISATRLAKELNHLIRLFDRQSIDIATIQEMDTTHLAQHWQDNYHFLKIISEHLPAILHEDGSVTLESYKNHIIEALATCWQQKALDYQVTAVLTTGHTKATRTLLQTISELPNGVVMLPNIDPLMSDDEWSQIDATHPLFHIKEFTDLIDIKSIESLLQKLPSHASSSKLNHLLHDVMLPTTLTNRWHDNEAHAPDSVGHVQYIECDHLNEEAHVISTIIRYYMDENDQQTIALVTSNFDLITLTENLLKKWQIEGDNSIGIPIGKTPIGSFMSLILESIPRTINPVSLLALLKHPLTACGLSNISCNQMARTIERRFLRGIHTQAITLAYIEAYVQEHQPPSDELLTMIRYVKNVSSKLQHALKRDKVDFKHILDVHINCAEMLATSNAGDSNTQSLWSTNEGQEYAKELQQLRHSSDSLESIDPLSYPEMYQSIFADTIIRKKYHSTPNLKILSPSEARLIRHDVTIIADCNDGTWPPREQYSPWLSTSLQKQLHLHSPERVVGEYAAIFKELFLAPNVIVTRSKTIRHAPTTISHWLQRFQASLRCDALDRLMKPLQPWQQWSHYLNTPTDAVYLKPPAPCPPIEARPKKLSATDIDLLIKNPYALYAKKVLILRKLQPIGEALDASDFGNLVHDILYRFCIQSNNSFDELMRLTHEALNIFHHSPNVYAIWLPKLESIMQWFYEKHNTQLQELSNIVYEETGSVSYEGVTVHAKADRIELSNEGVHIIDYKTGNPPSTKKVLAGVAPQMLVEAVIASNKGFPSISDSTVKHIAYWRMQGFDRNNESPLFEHHSEEEDNPIVLFETKLQALISLFNEETSPYLVDPIPEFASNNQNKDFHHLSRITEWKYHME
ncbi:MAG: double-strand break repair protein AddB [Rickettsiales bacterium]|nr:double-strand break repair protein AddB [Rickettsiales bacterium]